MLLEFLPEFLTVATIHFLAVISPGPDFALVTKNSLVHSRKVGVYTAIGIGIGIMVHVLYSLLGIGFVISQSILLFSIIKYLGAAYLLYLGYKTIRSAKKAESQELISPSSKSSLTKWQALRSGFITNALNPKATVFFLAVFTQVIDASTPLIIQLLYGIEMMVMTAIIFSVLAVFLSHRHVKSRFQSIQYYLEKTMGAVLIALGVKVAVSE